MLRSSWPWAPSAEKVGRAECATRGMRRGPTVWWKMADGRHADRKSAGAIERLQDVGGDVVDVLEPDGDTDQAGSDTHRLPLLLAELRVGRGRRMRHDRAGIAEVGRERAHADRVQEAA